MSGLEDTDLADEQLAMDAAYAEECEANRLDAESLGWAWALGLIPLGLVVLLLTALLGEWAWALFPAGFFAIVFALGRLRWWRRYESAVPLAVPGFGTFSGAAKKRLLLHATAFAAAVMVAQYAFPRALAAVVGWVAG